MARGEIDVRPLVAADLVWVIERLARVRERLVTYSPRLWRPAADAAAHQTAFLGWLIEQPDVVALRTEHGFVIGVQRGPVLDVDDFSAGDPGHDDDGSDGGDDDRWAFDGRALLGAAWAARVPDVMTMRVVTAERDVPKRRLLVELGLEVETRWWVQELDAATPAAELGLHRVDGGELRLVAAPPVYDPGGPVAIHEGPVAGPVDGLAAGAASLGAVLLILAVASNPTGADGDLVPAGFHLASEFRVGVPAGGAR